jgi:RNA polymerase sigma-70 factor (ECF subfamily)
MEPTAGGAMVSRVRISHSVSPIPRSRPPTSLVGRCRAPYDDGVHTAAAEVWQSVRLAQDGDSEAFAELYVRYADQIFHYLYLHVGNVELAEDFTSETFVRALRRIRTLHDQGRDPAAWFITIAHNILRDHRKSARARMEIVTADPPDLHSGHSFDPESCAVHQSLRECLHRCIQQLNQDQRRCIALRFFCGLSVPETARVMNRNTGAVKTLQYRALRRLEELVSISLLGY